MDKKLEKFLKENKIKFELHEHKKVYTAFNEAETQHLKAKEVAKVILVKTALPKNARPSIFGQFALIVIPAQKYVDFGKVKKALKARKVSMGKESDIAKVTKTKVGLIHPFGNLYELPVLLDNALAKQKILMASAGSYTESIEIKTIDYIKLVQPIKGAFFK